MSECELLIPGTHKVCGDDGEFCSQSCYEKEILGDILRTCVKFHFDEMPSADAIEHIERLLGKVTHTPATIGEEINDLVHDLWKSWSSAETVIT